jgi:hypothetical protein
VDCFTVLMEHVINVLGPPTVGRDAAGGTQFTHGTTRQSGVACLINVPGESEQERFSQEQIIGPVVVATFYTGLERGDVVAVTAGPTLVGRQLKVTGIKGQPGVDALGFDTIMHYTAELLK